MKDLEDPSLCKIKWYALLGVHVIALCTITFVGSLRQHWMSHHHTMPISIVVTEPPKYEPLVIDPPKRVQPVPIPKPAPQPTVACVELGAAHWTAYINSMAATDVEKAWLIKTASCESGLRNCAFSGTYCGIMQYLPATFASAGGTNIWDGAQQLTLALAYYRVHGTGAWPVCGN